MGTIRCWHMVVLLSCTTLLGQSVRHVRRTTPNIAANPIKDVLLLHKNLFSWDSLKVLALATPLYAIARSQDKRIHSYFYNEECHLNIRQLPRHCPLAATVGLFTSIVLLGCPAVFSRNIKLRTTSYVFLLGIPFVVLTKDIVKKWHMDQGKRPRNGLFSRDKCYYGGFPSGHLAQTIYMTILFGVQFGPKAWIPLGLLSAYTFGTFLNCNRHFASQMIAGGTLGTLYALAANKLINSKLSASTQFSASLSPRGHIQLQAGFQF